MLHANFILLYAIIFLLFIDRQLVDLLLTVLSVYHTEHFRYRAVDKNVL